MTRDEIRKLVSGYATGTLTESERSLLFEAALEDQELFDELAREQALKELLEVPGAKRRLIDALEPPKPVGWWMRPWPWAAAATALTAIVLGVFLLRPPAPSRESAKEVAAVIQPAVPVRQTVPEPAAQPGPAQSSAGSSSAEQRSPEQPAKAKKSIVGDSESAAKTAAEASPAASQQQRKDTPSSSAAPAPARLQQPPQSPQRQSPQPQSPQPQSPQPPSPQPSGAQASTPQAPAASDATAQSAVAENAAANQFVPNPSTAPPPPTAGRAMRAMAPAAVRAPGAAENLRSTGHFAFNYTVRADGHLEIRTLSSGYLRVTATLPNRTEILFPAGPSGVLSGGSISSVEIPAGATELEILFTARPLEESGARATAAKSAAVPSAPARSDAASNATPGGVAGTIGGAATGTPATVDATSGTAEDPNPSANSRLVVRVRVKPRE